MTAWSVSLPTRDDGHVDFFATWTELGRLQGVKIRWERCQDSLNTPPTEDMRVAKTKPEGGMSPMDGKSARACAFMVAVVRSRRLENPIGASFLQTSLSTIASICGDAMHPFCHNSLVVSRNIVVSFRGIRANVSLSGANMHRMQSVPFDASNPNEKQPSFSLCGSASFHKPKMTVQLRAEGQPHIVARFIHATWRIMHVRVRCTDVRTCPTK